MKKKVTVRFKKNGSVIVHSAGSTQEDCIQVLERRVAKRKIELDVYERFYKRYLSLKKAQCRDEEWIYYLKKDPHFFEDPSTLNN